ncbi:hypothetical protein [Legionella worsleiensis]|nr:hypothetical protein [Legionella worsleiensis]
MKLKKSLIDLKKIPLNLALLLLTFGASIILGFLSFSGMYALFPVLYLAGAAFGLSVLYEGEIYLQNIKGAFNKWFKKNYLENLLAKEYLLTHLKEYSTDEKAPQFFKDYLAQLKLLRAFGTKKLDAKSKENKRQVEKTLKDMEHWFAQQLFAHEKNPDDHESPYAAELKIWLAEHHQSDYQKKLEQRSLRYTLVKGFSVLAGIFMGLGSTYLIVEAFAVIPFFAAIPFALWPMIIVPMAVIAGAAYAMLTFNAITDLINNNTVVKWYNKIREDLSKGLSLRNVFIASTALFLVSLALALTICTAGTWWTIATNARPLFDWMKKMPTFIMGVINPVVTGLSAVFFNIQNSSESLEMVEKASQSKTNPFKTVYDYLVNGFDKLRQKEHWLQIINPFRIILKLTVTPILVLFFLGHLLSIALTSDRMPGVPQIISMLIAIICEGFEDAHYFLPHETSKNEPELDELLHDRLHGEDGHDHNTDIPTRVIKTLALPLYALAALWDCKASQLNESQQNEPADSLVENQKSRKPMVLSFTQAWNKQRGIGKEHSIELPPQETRPSKNWQEEHAVARIEQFKTKHLQNVWVDKDKAQEKMKKLEQLQHNIRHPQNGESLEQLLNAAQNQPVYNQHRLFAQHHAKTQTQEFIEELPQRIRIC